VKENNELKQVIEEMTSLIDKLKLDLDNHKNSLGKQSFAELTSKLLIKEKEYELLKRESALNLMEINKLNSKFNEITLKNGEYFNKIQEVIIQRDQLEQINFNIKKENIQMKREASDIHTFYENKLKSNTAQEFSKLMRLSGSLPTNLNSGNTNQLDNFEIKRNIEQINDIENKFNLDYVEEENDGGNNFEGFGEIEENISTIQKSDIVINNNENDLYH